MLAAVVIGLMTAAPGALAQELPLKVATVERQPFVIADGDQLSGFSIELWELITRELGRETDFQPKESFSAMLQAVTDKTADLAIANISITSERETAMDFSQPIFDAGLQILVPATGSGSGLISTILSWRMLSLVLLAFGVLFLIGMLMWFFERKKSPYFQRNFKDGMWPSFWWASQSLINGGFEERVPQTIPGRILATALMISTLFLVSVFVATLTSAMTVSQIRSDIESVSDLAGKRVGTTGNSTASAYLAGQGISHTEFGRLEALFDAVSNKQLDAIVHDAPILAFYAANEGKGRVQVTGQIFKAEKYGIALPDESELTEPINRALLKLRESGKYDELYRRWFE